MTVDQTGNGSKHEGFELGPLQNGLITSDKREIVKVVSVVIMPEIEFLPRSRRSTQEGRTNLG